MAQEILDLGGLAPERPLVKWEGELYELLVPEDMSALDMARLGRLFTEHDQLWEKDKRTAAEDKRLVKLLDDLTAKLIPDAPAEAVKAIPAIHKRGLAVRFFVNAGLVMQPSLEPLSRLANNSPDSADSTAEAQPIG